MKLLAALAKSFLPMLAGLLLGCYGASILVILLDTIGSSRFFEDLPKVPSAAWGLCHYAWIFAAPAMLVLHWPSYAFLRVRGHASYLSSSYVPLLLVFLATVVTSAKFALVVALYALLVAWLAHGLQLRFDGLWASTAASKPPDAG